MSLDPAWIALIGTIFGGVGLKVIDHYLNKRRGKIDDATRIRDELRIEVDKQVKEIERLEKQRDEWQAKYYNVFIQLNTLQNELTNTKNELKVALAKIQEQETAAQGKINGT